MTIFQTDLNWNVGHENMGGTAGKMFFLPIEDVDEAASTVAVDPDGVTLTGDIVPKSAKKFIEIYHTRGTGELRDELVGERDGKSYENMVEFFFPGSKKEISAFKKAVANTPGILICQDTNGNQRIIGVAILNGTAISYGFPAYLESAPSTSGKASSDRKGTTFTFKAEAPHDALFYEGVVTLTPQA
jgi:hypothetical protein